MKNLIIREASANDIPALTGLTAELGYPDSQEEIGRRFTIVSSSPGYKVFVAEKDNSVIGLMSFHALDILYGTGKIGRITALVITESERGKGIGKSLVAKAEELARESGCTRLELTTNVHRIAAHKFYESVGFEESSKRFIKKLE